MNDAQVRFTVKDVASLGTIAVMIAIQWGFTSSRQAQAEEDIKSLKIEDKEQRTSQKTIEIKLNSLEKDSAQIRKDMDELKLNLNKILEEVKKPK